MVSELQREEQIRDLRRSIDGLTNEDQADAPTIFRENSARRALQVLYRMVDGEPVRMKLALAKRVIHSYDPRSGKPKWTTDPAQAPTWNPGTVKCFMHPESVEAESGILGELGIAPVCDAGNLRNQNAKRTHGRHCHKDSWATLQEYIQSEERRKDREMRQEEVGAMKAMAGGNRMAVAEATPTPNTELPYDANGVSVPVCEKCGASIEGTDSFAKARHMKNCPAKDGE